MLPNRARLRPVLIAGPTAGGKSALALALAERDDGVVINADALQVYDCWRILTARPGAEDLARAPHALYGHVDRRVRYSVGDWLRDVEQALGAAERSGRRAIIVGGTGLYLTALTTGLAQIPPVPADVRAASTAHLEAGRLEVFHRDLAERDPETYARIDRMNPMRLQRAWEVLIGTGRSLAAWHRTGGDPILPVDRAECFVINPERDLLNSKISKRFQMMIREGAITECRTVLATGWDPHLPSSRALGARELVRYLEGELDLDTATTLAITATRQFAKRQRTWFRNRMTNGRWLDLERATPVERLLAAIPS